jgi:hypothetical protein
MLWYGNRARLRTDNILHWRFLQWDRRSLRNRSRIVSRYSSAPTFIARVTHFIGTTIHRFYALPMGILEFLFREVIAWQTLLYLFACSTILFVGSCFILHLWVCLTAKEKVNLNHGEDHKHKILLNWFLQMEAVYNFYSTVLYWRLIYSSTMYSRKRLRWSRGSVLAFSTQVRGFKPGRSRRIFKGEKNPQHAFFRRGSKAVCPMS